MGRGNRKKRKGGGGNDGGGGRGGKRSRPSPGQGRRGNYKETAKESPAFVAYYQKQTFMPPEEWDEFMAALRRPLPTTFRITGTRSSAADLRDSLRQFYFDRLGDIELDDGTKIAPPRPITWYPDDLAWHTNLSRALLRRRDDLKSFHSFLVEQNGSGNISRQEAVSMIPPLLLDVQPHHKVLDMCAAPGSKTAQLIGALHAGGDPVPEGLVVANDNDAKRCYLLVHQSKRLQSPNFMITNHDAALFPNLRVPRADGATQPLRYDRVLCDVPCTGDGTLRKNVNAWGKWTPNNAMGLHDLQCRILYRGIELAAVGGVIVFSTCSFNPVENEAVVAAALRKFKGSLELVDASDRLPLLKRLPGVASWTVMSKAGDVVSGPEEAPEGSNKFTQSVFPPAVEEAEWMHLERCLRLMPHHQDTGGFFVAVLKKTSTSSIGEAR
eukprot:UC1_evm1s151